MEGGLIEKLFGHLCMKVQVHTRLPVDFGVSGLSCFSAPG